LRGIGISKQYKSIKGKGTVNQESGSRDLPKVWGTGGKEVFLPDFEHSWRIRAWFGLNLKICELFWPARTELILKEQPEKQGK
jgi:hypothetical protein